MNTTYFGMWSGKKICEVAGLLSQFGARYEVTEDIAEQNVLEESCAWDAIAENPFVGFDLWICTDDLPKLGTKLADAFPERNFDAV